MRRFLLTLITLSTLYVSGQQQLYKFSNYPSGFFKFNDLLYFVGESTEYGRELWYTDGVSTKMLKDINPGSQSSMFTFVDNLAILNGHAYFIAKDQNSDGEIWKTDGTSEGTTKVTNFVNGRVLKLTVAGNHIFFLIKANDSLEVWKTDGTLTGTMLVKNNLPIWNTPSFQGACNNFFIFTFQPYGINDSRVWRSDGTSSGTVPLTGEIDGNGSGPGGTSALTQYITYNNKLYFVSRYFLHETDGTPENTRTITNLWQATTNLVTYSDVAIANNKMYFLFYSAENNEQKIWESNGSNAETNLIYSIKKTNYFYPSNLQQTDTSLIFCSADESGISSVMSLNYRTHIVSPLLKLNNGENPGLFNFFFHGCSILKISNGNFFINTPPDKSRMRKGWIIDFSGKIAENVTALDTVQFADVYKQQLYYSKNNILWRYSQEPPVDTGTTSPATAMVYPNPATNFIMLNTSNNEKIESVAIYDMSGRLITQLPIYNDKIDITRLQKGSYVLRYKVNEKIVSTRFLKF